MNHFLLWSGAAFWGVVSLVVAWVLLNFLYCGIRGVVQTCSLLRWIKKCNSAVNLPLEQIYPSTILRAWWSFANSNPGDIKYTNLLGTWSGVGDWTIDQKRVEAFLHHQGETVIQVPGD